MSTTNEIWVSDALFLFYGSLLPFCVSGIVCWIVPPQLSLLSLLCFFLYPDLEQGSWVQLMMMKDMWKRQSGAKPGFRSSILVDQPCAATSSPLRGASQTVPGNHLVKGSTSRRGTADSCKMNCSRTETLPERSCSFAAMIGQMVPPSFFWHVFF